ncbi:GNAT family N-acetyltransferase [Lishizhenia sp.]|uniref:GNAT family N-acetyltransferase n=1 Tax=Lishizhenia sp. TaxID=2497594 RepID=UPI00299EED93|nr:GNAT family N-acetyltransferase [Lishizhenia sp.]MDX1445120.1 GNAT family N-acetyltransferase [Lishizhenia sp.]
MIERIAQEEVQRIEDLARATWPDTFKEILTPDQIEYMLNWMYNVDTLKEQISKGHEFYIYKDQEDLGFIGLEPNYEGASKLRIHKIYVLPAAQGKKVGKQLMDFAEKRAQELSLACLNLNVNRYNAAVDFYKHIGFQITKTEDIDIGEGFFMNDYVMEKAL